MTPPMTDEAKIEWLAQHAYARWAPDNEPQSFPAPYIVEHTAFMAGYRIAAAARPTRPVKNGALEFRVSNAAYDFMREQGFSGGWDHDLFAKKLCEAIQPVSRDAGMLVEALEDITIKAERRAMACGSEDVAVALMATAHGIRLALAAFSRRSDGGEEAAQAPVCSGDPDRCVKCDGSACYERATFAPPPAPEEGLAALIEQEAECFTICPQCGYQQNEALKETDLWLMFEEWKAKQTSAPEVGEETRMCQARRSTPDGPQDCDWPVCGCDPTANKVIAALEEAGASPPTPAIRTTYEAAWDDCRAWMAGGPNSGEAFDAYIARMDKAGGEGG